jgi:YD repeat-containing protein
MIRIERVVYLAVLLALGVLAAAPAHAVDRWAAFHGDFCCGIPESLLKYMDAESACQMEAPAPPSTACATTLSPTRSVLGPNPPSGHSTCVYDWVCNCGSCLIGFPGHPANVHIGDYAGRVAHRAPTPAPACGAGTVRDFLACTSAKAKTKGAAACGVGKANPCNVGSGNKYQTELVYPTGPGGLGLELWYNSLPGVYYFDVGAFGAKWTGRYFVTVRDTAQGIIAVNRPDGRELEFRAPPSGTLYLKDADVNETLERLTSGAGATVGWRLTDPRTDEVDEFDAAGKLLLTRDRAGRQSIMTYSDASTPPSIAPAAGLLITVTDHFGRQLNYTYNAQSRVASLIDPAGAETLFEYDGPSGPAGAKNLTKVTFPDLKTRVYHYGEAANINGGAACATPSPILPNVLTGLTDENGVRFSTWTYQCDGRVASSEHAGGADRHTFSYGAGTRSWVDPLNTSRSMSAASIIGAIKNLGTTQPAASGSGTAGDATTYDANGNVASMVDFAGNRTNYAYDLVRNLQTSRTEGLTAAGGTTPQTRTITTAWHATFRLAASIAEPLRITTNTYDADGTVCGARGALCSKSVQPTTDGNGSQGFSATASGAPRVWTYLYNANGSVLSMNGPRTDATDVTTYTYYPNDDVDPGKRGNVATISNGLGHTTSITAYNAHGQPLTLVDPNGLTTTMAYDARQRLASRTVGSEITSYTYDGVGQLTRVTLPDGSFLEYDYDDAHRLIALSDNLGNRIAYALDAMGNRTAEQVFDPSNALAQTRSRVFNNLNRLSQERGAQNQTTEYTYDNQGNVVSVKDPLDKVTSNQYDALNRLKQVTDPGLGVTQYGYNGLDALVSVSDPRSLVTGYSVDGLGNLVEQQSPDTGTTANTYDAAGNLLTQTDAKGQVTTYAYDALNRVTLITFHDGSKQQYLYDGGMNGIGRLTSITERDPANQQTYQTSYLYDQHGRALGINTEHAGVIYNVGYSYDSAGRLTSVSYPSGRTVNYGFDALGRVNLVTTTKNGETQPIVSQVAYQPFGGVKSFTFGNGQVYARGIDLDGRIGSYSLGAQSFGINYDAASRITMISDLANAANQNTYGYDSLDRLTGAFIAPATAYGYTYDAVGNRTSKTAGATELYSYSNTSNRIATVGTRSFSFDANGSTTADGNNTYAYDVRGRMVQATSSIGATSYKVNALGQRVRKTNSQADTVFHYDTNGRLIAESDPGGGVKRELIYLGDIPVFVWQ